ncbi:hypothetical protein H5410_003368, partial [Solanum commersonii]
MQRQAQQRYSNALTQGMIPYSHTMVQQLIASESQSTLTLIKMNTMHDFTYSSLKIKKVFSRLVMGLSVK